jgi:hypothetical protein
MPSMLSIHAPQRWLRKISAYNTIQPKKKSLPRVTIQQSASSEIQCMQGAVCELVQLFR